MFNSLLNAGSGSINSLILDVFIILAVVLAGSLIVYFLFEMVNALVSKSGKPKSEDRLIFDEKEKEAEEQGIVTSFNLDEEKQEETVVEEQKEEVVETVYDEDEVVEVSEAQAEAEQAEMEQSEEERQNAERRAYLEARRQEILRRMQENAEAEEAEEESEEVTEETEESVEQIEDPEPIQEVEETEVTEESVEEQDNLDEERKALQEEKERYETMVRELEQAKKALAEQNSEPVVKTVVVNKKLAGLSIDELKKKLEKTEARLASTEKEFKQCKKEFIPLQKVWTTHERDEKKLRRKEALVAKQKVLLYGVNNYADIDEEKAKKLSEDLDLLDGLKLSVQHCEEVMKNNEERYPLLEKMYNVLKARNEELKNDVESLTAEIERLEKEQEEANSENE